MTDPTDYDNAPFIPDGAGYWKTWEAKAASFRAAQPGARLDVPYGAHPREAFDLYLPDSAPPAGLFVFVHGGFWKAGDRTLWSHLAAGPLARGWAVGQPSYPLCPEIRVGAITRSIARAVAAMAEEVAGPIVLAGHSAGGHLVLRMVCPDSALPAQVARRIRGVLPISPLTDLAPLMAMPMNEDLRIDAAEARAESPVHHPAPSLPVEVLVGAAERPAFLDQALWLGDAWPGTGVTLAPARHHFDVIEALEDPDAPLLHRWAPAPSAE